MASATSQHAPGAPIMAGILLPGLAVLTAGPFIVGALRFLFDSFDSTMLLIAAPVLVGLLAAPGYLYALLRWPHLGDLGPPRRWWIRVSLGATLLASLAGAIFSAVLILPAVASLATAINLLVVWWRLERRDAKASV